MGNEIIQADDVEIIINSLKALTSSQMIKVENLLLNGELPKRENYSTEEEYQRDYKLFMTDAIDIVEDAKKCIFTNALDSYNDLLFSKYDIEKFVREQNEMCAETVLQSNRDIKNTVIAGVILSFIIPSAIPLIVIISLGRIGYKVVKINLCTNAVADNFILQEALNKIQIPFYEFVDTLRTDYHKSNKEIKELRGRAKNGENIMGELLEIIDPERLSLKRVEELPFGDTEEKQHVKERQ